MILCREHILWCERRCRHIVHHLKEEKPSKNCNLFVLVSGKKFISTNRKYVWNERLVAKLKHCTLAQPNWKRTRIRWIAKERRWESYSKVVSRSSNWESNIRTTVIGQRMCCQRHLHAIIYIDFNCAYESPLICIRFSVHAWMDMCGPSEKKFNKKINEFSTPSGFRWIHNTVSCGGSLIAFLSILSLLYAQRLCNVGTEEDDRIKCSSGIHVR